MIRITKMSGRFYGIKASSVMADAHNIETFAKESTPVIIVDSLEDLEDLGIEADEVTMV